MFRVWQCVYFDDPPFYEIMPSGLSHQEANVGIAKRWPDWKGIALECDTEDIPLDAWTAIPDSVKPHII